MKQELEIEYKNLLNQSEYQSILHYEFSNAELLQSTQKRIQTNYYFDTCDKKLKKEGAALRIRTQNSHNELTFKVPSANFLMETNLELTAAQTEYVLNKGSLQLSELTKQKLEIGLSEINEYTIFKYFNHFKTTRYEKKEGANLLVLDQTIFQNETIDYELEVEGQNPQAAKKFFQSILNKYSIPIRPTLPKIARAEKNKRI